jgi:hypothetical protein
MKISAYDNDIDYFDFKINKKVKVKKKVGVKCSSWCKTIKLLALVYVNVIYWKLLPNQTA